MKDIEVRLFSIVRRFCKDAKTVIDSEQDMDTKFERMDSLVTYSYRVLDGFSDASEEDIAARKDDIKVLADTYKTEAEYAKKYGTTS